MFTDATQVPRRWHQNKLTASLAAQAIKTVTFCHRSRGQLLARTTSLSDDPVSPLTPRVCAALRRIWK
jgi:hypothetical protein